MIFKIYFKYLYFKIVLKNLKLILECDTFLYFCFKILEYLNIQPKFQSVYVLDSVFSVQPKLWTQCLKIAYKD